MELNLNLGSSWKSLGVKFVLLLRKLSVVANIATLKITVVVEW